MKNCRYCDAVTRNFAYDVCDECRPLDGAPLLDTTEVTTANPNATPWPKITIADVFATMAEHPAFLAQHMMDHAMLPARTLLGHGASGTALAAEERRQRRDDHVDALQYALNGYRRHGKSEAIVAPKPPTLREWLGDRVSDLGPWAEVLREQPVPAGCFTEWAWLYPPTGPVLQAYDSVTRGWVTILPEGVPHLWDTPKPDHGNGCADAMEMALFTRHPDVKPDPRPAAIVCEDQYEVMP